MMTPKEALIKDNATRPESERIPVKEGRGRMSRTAVERIHWLISTKGWAIKGYEAVKPSKPVASNPTAPSEPVKVKRVPVTGVKEVQDFVIFFPEESFKAQGKDRVWSMRECCNNCRVSLVQCHCEDPVILGGIKVSILPKT